MARPVLCTQRIFSLTRVRSLKISSCVRKFSGYLAQSDLANASGTCRSYTADGLYWIKTLEGVTAKAAHIEIGMTKYLFDSQVRGSVDSISPPSNNVLMPYPSSFVIRWSGLKISSGDELYHAIWENVDGEIEVEPFLPLKLANFSKVEYNSTTMKNVANLEKDEWFLRIYCSQEEVKLLGPVISSLKDQKQHGTFCALADTAENSTSTS